MASPADNGGHFPDRAYLSLTGGTLTGALSGTSLSLSSTLTVNSAGVGTAATVAASVGVNSTAAANGAQQYSGVLEVGSGQGWKIDATAASMPVKWGVRVRPVQGTAAPTSILDFLSSINGAAYAASGKFMLYSNGSVEVVGAPITASGAGGYLVAYRTDGYALYAAAAAGGASVGSSGVDVHTAGPLVLGAVTATSVKAGRTGIPVHLAAHNAAPTDADLVAGGITFFLDETTHKISARVRYADGTTYKTITTPIPIS